MYSLINFFMVMYLYNQFVLAIQVDICILHRCIFLYCNNPNHFYSEILEKMYNGLNKYEIWVSAHGSVYTKKMTNIKLKKLSTLALKQTGSPRLMRISLLRFALLEIIYIWIMRCLGQIFHYYNFYHVAKHRKNCVTVRPLN